MQPGSPAAPDRYAPLPPADLHVIDLAGRGMGRWSEAAQDNLYRVLDGTLAVLVAPAFDDTWKALDGERMKGQPLVLLHKPYGIKSMDMALTQAAAGCAAPGAAATPVVAAKPPVSAPVASGGKLAVSDFQACAGKLPGTPLFIRSLAEALASQLPFEVRVSFINRMVFHPGEQWVASNTPPPVLAHLCQDDALASAIEIDTIDGNDATTSAEKMP